LYTINFVSYINELKQSKETAERDNSNETNVSTTQAQKKEYAWVSCANGDKKWAKSN
jgi:hypothetical protein